MTVNENFLINGFNMNGPHIRRLYYSTTEVSRMIDVRPYIIRKWEKKFSFFKSVKKHSGRKFFKPSDIETVKKIKRLKEVGYTNEKINQIIANDEDSAKTDMISLESDYSAKQLFQEIYNELREILKILNSDI